MRKQYVEGAQCAVIRGAANACDAIQVLREKVDAGVRMKRDSDGAEVGVPHAGFVLVSPVVKESRLQRCDFSLIAECEPRVYGRPMVAFAEDIYSVRAPRQRAITVETAHEVPEDPAVER